MPITTATVIFVTNLFYFVPSLCLCHANLPLLSAQLGML